MVTVGVDSYGNEAGLTAYAAARGVTLVTDLTVLLTKAMDYIENLNYKGWKTDLNQVLQWPRVYVIVDYRYLLNTEIPTLLVQGQYEVAMAIDVGNGPLETIDIAVLSEKVDVIAVTYRPNASSTPIVRTINAKLRKLLRCSPNGNFISVHRA